MDNSVSLSKRIAAAAVASVMAICGGTFTAGAEAGTDDVSIKMSLLAGGSVIGVRFTLDTEEDDLDVTIDDKAVEPDTSGAYTIYEYSMNMAVEHDIVVKKGDDVLKEQKASVASYLKKLVNDENYSGVYGELAANMLLYGGASQEYFGSEYDLVSEGIEETRFSTQEIDGAPFDKEDFNDLLEGSPVSYYGMNLSLKERTGMNLFFKKADDSDEAKGFLEDFTFGDNDASPAENGENFFTISTTFSAIDLFEETDFTNGDIVVSFSPVQYIAAAQEAGNEKLAKVCKALYAYGLAAADFEEPAVPIEDPTEPTTEETTEPEDPEPLLEPKGTIHSGLATQYDITKFGDGENNLGQAMLRDVMDNKDLYAAVSTEDYATGTLAGAYIEVTYGNSKANALVIDTFGGDDHDHSGNVDLGPKVFEQLNSVAQGDIDVTWKILPYDKPHVNYRLKDKTFNAGWFAIQVYDHKYPIWSLEVKQGDQFVNVPRKEYNYFVYDSGFGAGPYTIRLTDIYGHVIIDENVDLSSGTAEGKVQFPD